MKLSRTLFAAATVSAFCVTAASAVTVEQCQELGGTVDLAQAECELSDAQQDEARALGWLPGGGGTEAAAGGGAGLGSVGVGGGTLAAGLGLVLAVVAAGDGSSSTTTTSPSL